MTQLPKWSAAVISLWPTYVHRNFKPPLHFGYLFFKKIIVHKCLNRYLNTILSIEDEKDERYYIELQPKYNLQRLLSMFTNN